MANDTMNQKRAEAILAALPAARVAESRRSWTIQEIEVMARKAAGSRLFGMDADQAFTLMCLCYSEGLDPIQALRRYHIINGRPSMQASAMLAEWQRAGGSVEWLEEGPDGCAATFRHPRHCPGGVRVEFTAADAQRAGLLERDTWKKYPGAMYRARVISAAIRKLLPGIVMGIYTPEELADWTPDLPPREDPPLRERPWATGPARPRLQPPSPPTTDPGPGPVAPPLDGGGGPPGPGPSEEPVSELRAFIRRAIKEATDEVRNNLIFAGKLADRERPAPIANEHQVANALISAWIADGFIDAPAIATPDGKRDRAKVAAVLRAEYEASPAEIEDEVREYLHDKAEEVYRARGLRPGDRDEAQATADDDPAGGEHGPA